MGELVLTLKRLAAAIAAIITFLAFAELSLNLLPVQAGLGAADPVPGWPAHRLIPGTHYTFSAGWAMDNIQRGWINNAGYIAPFDYRDGAEVGVVIGDSFIEGYMNPYRDMLQSRLAVHLGLAPSSVYNFGTSGASLPHYLGVARLVGTRYRAKWAVILIGPDDFIEGFQYTPGYFGWGTPTNPARIIPVQKKGHLAKLIRESALVRYIRGNLKFSSTTLFASGFPPLTGTCRPPALSRGDRALVSAWLDQLPSALRLEPQQIVLVSNTDLAPLHLGGKKPPACPTRDSQARALLMSEAVAAGLHVVDIAPLFAQSWAQNHHSLDRAPIDKHWNPHGHEIVAQAVARELGGTTAPR